MAENSTDKNKQYPALAEMGIIRPSEISHYSLRQDGAEKDVLRIIYNRAKGSFLPYSRKYKFGRSMKAVITDGGTSRMEQTYEISPFLLKAVNELDALVEANKHSTDKPSTSDLKSDLVAEIDELKLLINESITSDNMTAVHTKIENVRKHIEAL